MNSTTIAKESATDDFIPPSDSGQPTSKLGLSSLCVGIRSDFVKIPLYQAPLILKCSEPGQKYPSKISGISFPSESFSRRLSNYRIFKVTKLGRWNFKSSRTCSFFPQSMHSSTTISASIVDFLLVSRQLDL